MRILSRKNHEREKPATDFESAPAPVVEEPITVEEPAVAEEQVVVDERDPWDEAIETKVLQ